MVFKIVPMEGSTLVNGEPQKRAAEMLAEVEIALALSAVRGPLSARRSPSLDPARMLANANIVLEVSTMRRGPLIRISGLSCQRNSS